MSAPWNATLPRAAVTTPAMLFSVVDLPAPLRPSSVTISASPTVSDTPCSMWLLP